jgi:hypothetical protein
MVLRWLLALYSRWLQRGDWVRALEWDNAPRRPLRWVPHVKPTTVDENQALDRDRNPPMSV